MNADDNMLFYSYSQALPVLYPSLRAVIGTLTFTQLVSILRDFTAALPDSKDSRLTLACQNKVCTFFLFLLLIGKNFACSGAVCITE